MKVEEKGGPGRRPGPPSHISHLTSALLVHPTHATARRGRGSGFLLLLLDDEGFRREEERGDRRGVLERRAGHLRRVDDAREDEVLVRVGERVVAEVLVLRGADLLDDD